MSSEYANIEYSIEQTARVAASWWRDQFRGVRPAIGLRLFQNEKTQEPFVSRLSMWIVQEWQRREKTHVGSWPEDIPAILLLCWSNPCFALSDVLNDVGCEVQFAPGHGVAAQMEIRPDEIVIVERGAWQGDHWSEDQRTVLDAAQIRTLGEAR